MADDIEKRDHVLDCTILTPERSIFRGAVKSIVIPGEDGYFGVLYNHAPLLSTIGDGEIKVTGEDGTDRHWHVKGGFVQVLRNKVSVLTTKIEEVEKKRTSWN